jgi:hypothetical protein
MTRHLATTTLVLVSVAVAACQNPAPKTLPGSSIILGKAPQPSGLSITVVPPSAPSPGSGQSAAGPAVTLTLSAESGLALPSGLNRQLKATETFSDGTSADVTATVQWSSSNAATGMVSTSGLLTTAGVGNATVTASLGVLSDSFPLSVEPEMTSIAIQNDLSALWVGDVQQLVLVATLADMSTLDVSGQAAWTSSAAGVATVATGGVVTGVSAGTATIGATVGSLSTSSQATVLASQPALTSIALGAAEMQPPSAPAGLLPGFSQALGVWGTYSETNAVQNITLLTDWGWTSSDMGVATVSSGGVVKAVGAGMTTISVSGLGYTASLNISVTAAVQSISIAGLPASLGPDTYLFPDVLATLADGSVVDVTTWARLTSSNRHIAGVFGQALLGRSAGTVTVTATLGSFTATSHANVKSISSVQVVPSTLSMPAGSTDNWVAAFATLSDGSMSEVTQSVDWTSSMTSIADFGMSGPNQATSPLTGAMAGGTTITAGLGALSANGQVTITPAVTVSALTISPDAPTLHFGSGPQLTATATLSDGSMVDVTPFVTWGTAGSTGGFTFSSDFIPGACVGLSPAGPLTITATLGSVMASTTGTVSDSAISSIAVSPPTITLSSGQKQPVTVTATYADGSTGDVTALAVWSSTDTAGTIAVVDETPTDHARVVAEGTGTATLTAWVTPSGPFVAGAVATPGTATVTVQ